MKIKILAFAQWAIVFLLIHQVQAKDQPNIIFILTDDQRWDALGYAGNEVIHTPEMDRLAREGVYFRNAFVTTLICAASRASILTGMYERTHGYTFGQGQIKKAYLDRSYPKLMRDSGYYTGFFGKFGVSYDSIVPLFDVMDNYDRNGKFRDRRGYFYKTIQGDTVHLTRYTGQQAMDFIADAPADQPFCLSLSFSAPHAHDPAPEQYFWQGEVDGLYRDIEIGPPPLDGDQYFQAQPPYVREGEKRTRWGWRYDTAEKYQHSVKGYYRMLFEIPEEWQGKSLMGYVKGENPVKDRTEFISEHLWEEDIIPPSEGLRTTTWKYFRYRNDPQHEELYNLELDPQEENNLAGDSNNQDKLKDIRQRFMLMAKELEEDRLE